jgi:hypothetical protein
MTLVGKVCMKDWTGSADIRRDELIQTAVAFVFSFAWNLELFFAFAFR